MFMTASVYDFLCLCCAILIYIGMIECRLNVVLIQNLSSQVLGREIFYSPCHNWEQFLWSVLLKAGLFQIKLLGVLGQISCASLWGQPESYSQLGIAVCNCCSCYSCTKKDGSWWGKLGYVQLKWCTSKKGFMFLSGDLSCLMCPVFNVSWLLPRY